MGGGALGNDAAFRQLDDLGVELEGFGDVVGDREDWGMVFLLQRRRLAMSPVTKIEVEAGEGFVEKQRPTTSGRNCSGECDAPGFAAGEVGWALVCDVRDAEV